MNDVILMQLKILVERAVRPVQTSATPKQKMREELLAHVSTVFAEELAARGDEQTALQRTAQRFGNATDLTRQLQETVKARERIFWHSECLVVNQSREPAPRHALRLAMHVGAFCCVFLGIGILVQVARGHGSEWLTFARIPPLFAPAWMAMLTFGGTLIVHGMRRALFGSGRSWLRVALIAAAAWLSVPITTFVICLALLADVDTSMRDALELLAYGALVPLAMILGLFLAEPEVQRQQEWANLQID